MSINFSAMDVSVANGARADNLKDFMNSPIDAETCRKAEKYPDSTNVLNIWKDSK
ncbi:MAG: hypothetical protein MHPSP_002939, partial [Paramarteilia canceri]